MSLKGFFNNMKDISYTVLPYYQVDDDLYVVISFSLDESGEYDKIETMLLCTENEDLDKIYPK